MTDSNTATNRGGKPFTKGDPRINRKGRPKSFDALRELAQQIAHEQMTTKDKDGNTVPLVIAGHVATVAETILRQWAMSKNPVLQKGFIEIAFGKVPDEIKNTGAIRLVVVYDDQESDAGPDSPSQETTQTSSQVH